MAARWTTYTFVPVCSDEAPMAWPCRTKREALKLAQDLHSSHTSAWVTKWTGTRQETVATFTARSLEMPADEEEAMLASMEQDSQWWRDAGFTERPLYA